MNDRRIPMGSLGAGRIEPLHVGRRVSAADPRPPGFGRRRGSRPSRRAVVLREQDQEHSGDPSPPARPHPRRTGRGPALRGVATVSHQINRDRELEGDAPPQAEAAPRQAGPASALVAVSRRRRPDPRPRFRVARPRQGEVPLLLRPPSPAGSINLNRPRDLARFRDDPRGRRPARPIRRPRPRQFCSQCEQSRRASNASALAANRGSTPGSVVEIRCFVHSRRKFFVTRRSDLA